MYKFNNIYTEYLCILPIDVHRNIVYNVTVIKREAAKRILRVGRDTKGTHAAAPSQKKRKGEQNMKYDLRKIMLRAWRLYREGKGSFAECLHRAWISAKAAPVNEQRIAAVKAAAGVGEETNTWAGWREHGFAVAHGSRALFSAELIHGSKGDGKTYRASFFGLSQVQPITA